MKEPQLRSLAKEWQKVLRLQDWDIHVFQKRVHSMPSGTTGMFDGVATKRIASIFVLHPIDYPPDVIGPYDEEQTLVHELLHAYFSTFWDDCSKKHRVAMEQAIDGLAWALVNLKRRSEVKKRDKVPHTRRKALQGTDTQDERGSPLGEDA